MRWSRVVNVVYCHAEGEVGNVVTGGVGDVPGATVFEKRLYLEREMDDLRKLLLFEPRGAVVHNANIIVPATHPDAQLGYVILEATEYPAMSGSNTMCVATVLLETGMLPMTEPVTRLTLESPAGLITVECTCRDGKVLRVRFTNQPAFVYHLQAPVDVAGIGSVMVDVAYGGMTYALVDASALGFGLEPDEARDLCVLGQHIKAAADEQLVAVHPENPLIAGITQTEFMGPVRMVDGIQRARNAVIVSPGRVDRSPCGTGTSARLAVMSAKGQIRPGEDFVHESIIGTTFDSRIESTTRTGPFASVVTSVAGQAWITAMSQVGLDPTDPLSHWLHPVRYVVGDPVSTANRRRSVVRARARTRTLAAAQVGNYIDNAWTPATGDVEFDVDDPATGETLTRTRAASPGDVDEAVASACFGPARMVPPHPVGPGERPARGRGPLHRTCAGAGPGWRRWMSASRSPPHSRKRCPVPWTPCGSSPARPAS